jgi:hypothetical protein
MNQQYATSDPNSIKTFCGLGTGEDVLVNADPKGRIVILNIPPIEDIKIAIDQYILKRFNNWWNEIILKVVTQENRKKTRTHYSQKVPYLRGLQVYQVARRNKRKTEDYTTVLKYLRTTPLMPHIHNLPAAHYAKVSDHLAGLSLEEQKELLQKVRPSTINEFQELIKVDTVNEYIIQFNFHKFLEHCETSEAFFDGLSSVIYKRPHDTPIGKFSLCSTGQSASPRIVEFLSWLNQKGWILFNKRAVLMQGKYAQDNSRPIFLSFLRRPEYSSELQVKLMKKIADEYGLAFESDNSRYEDIAFKRICLFIKSSTVKDIGDFSPELVAFNENEMEAPDPSAQAFGTIKHITSALVRLFKNDERYLHIEFPDLEQVAFKDNKLNENRLFLRTHGFRWVLEKNPNLKTWADLFEEYVNQKKVQSTAAIVQPLNRWLDFLLTLENPPLSPEQVNRSAHIRNIVNQTVNTYWNFIASFEIVTANKNRTLSKLRLFFEYYHDKIIAEFNGNSAELPMFTNPVREEDNWQSNRRRKTYRYALPTELLDMLREILLDRDENGIPTFNWAKKTFTNDWTTQCDVETRETVRGWWPGRAISLYVLLTIPIRTFQVRWLDEGVGDEFVYDFELQSMVPNPHPLAEKDRCEGLFRVIGNTFNKTSFLGVYINTNKTKIWDKSIASGYEIPWADNEFFSILKIMMDWNRKFSPNPIPVTFADDPRETISEAAKPHIPTFFPLFRDITAFNGRSRHIPITREKIMELWSRLLAEAENRLREQGEDIQLVDWLIQQRYSPTHPMPKAKYDLHTLRVSGITSLIEKGVPVHIVSEFIVGHSTIIMTLYYAKTNPLKAREMLLQAQNMVNSDLNAWVSLLKTQENPEPMLVWNNFDSGNEDAVAALKANKGLWTIRLDGICPGTICEDGGPIQPDGTTTPIPSGACGLCRFFITGPAFLFGQMQKVNNLMYKMREKGETLRGLRLKEIDLEDSNNKLGQINVKGERERIERELKDITEEWYNRIKMFQASHLILDEYEKLKKGVTDSESSSNKSEMIPLVTANDEEGLKSTIKNGTNFGLVRQITLMHEFLGNFDFHKAPILEYEEILNTILVKNDLGAFLLTISKERRIAAANMLGEFLVNSFGEEDVERLYTGEIELSFRMKKVTQEVLNLIKSGKSIIPLPIREKEKNRGSSRLVQIQGMKDKNEISNKLISDGRQIES